MALLSNVCFMDENGEYKPVGHIEEGELLSAKDNDVENSFLRTDPSFLSTDPIEITCQIENPTDIEKHIVYGGNKGRYNGHVLQRDGYLSPENGWV